jgi:hypothetical protein
MHCPRPSVCLFGWWLLLICCERKNIADWLGLVVDKKGEQNKVD